MKCSFCLRSLLIVIVSSVFFGCTEEPTFYQLPSRVDSISVQNADTETLVVKGDWQYPPFEYLDGEGKPAGFNVDVFKAVQKVLGLEMIIELGPWHEVRQELEDGRINALMGMFKTPGRAQKVDFSIPHFIASYNLFVPGGSDIHAIEEARDSRILVQRGDLAHDFLVENGYQDSLIIKNSVLDVIQSLVNGEGDCALASLTQGVIILDRLKINSLKVIPESVLTGSYCIGVPKGDTRLLALLNEGLNLIKNNGEYDRIYEKWFGLVEDRILLGSRIARIVLIAAGAVFSIGLFWTITLRRQVAQKTRALNRELIHSREIQDNLEKAVKAKTLFLANISHELRTPVNGFLGMIALLRKTEVSEKQKEYIDMADHAAGYLLNLIDDLIDTAQLENSRLRLHLAEFNLKDLITSSIQLMEKPAGEKGLTIKSDIPASLVNFFGDKTRIGQVLINLLSNAVKYSESGTITVKARLNTRLVITVTDEGIGIPKEQIPVIFDTFQQLESPYTKTHHGAGLGLAIVKSLVGLMEGELKVQSQEGKGSSFTVIIPPGRLPPRQIQNEEGQKEYGSDSSRDHEGMKILIVEDERINQLFLRRILETRGYQVLAASNGKEAVDMAIHEKPDFILMDIGLPVMDGKEATRILKARREFTAVPIIALTAHSGNDEAQSFIKAGGNGVIIKPFREAQIFEAIKKRYAWTSNSIPFN